ncbi:MAG TPA: hemolysin III family protein [Gemmatimonadaceae bacterium]|nr:hemolysin III family protein [Gemmatimonadaceae bacterium]
MSVAERAQTIGEEIANSITHGAGLAASIAALPVLIILAARHDAWRVVGATIFGATLVLLYGASTMYHALARTRARRVMRVLDHSAIYLLIAGTYTPFMLGPMRGPWGWSLLGAIWGMAVLGIVFKATLGIRYPIASTGVYVLMGWLAVVAARPLLASVGLAGVGWLVAGGTLYTLGVVFFALDRRVRYAHSVWHVFVAAGSICHFVAVVRYAIPDAG